MGDAVQGRGGVEFDLEELRAAFALRIVHMIVTADEVIQEAERDFVERLFPPEGLDAGGMLDAVDNRFTQRFSQAIAQAPQALAASLATEDKLALLRLFFQACEVDGDVDPRELSVVVQAARMLSLPQENLVREVSLFLHGRSGAAPEPMLLVRRTDTRVARPPRRAPAAGTSVTTTQEGLRQALSSATDTASVSLREGIAELLDPAAPTGTLTVAITPVDFLEGRIQGVESLVEHLVRTRTLLALAGRLDLHMTPPGEEKDDPWEVPEVRDFLVDLVAAYPWLPAWLDPLGGAAAPLLAACVRGDVREAENAASFIAYAVAAANYAVALTRALGGEDLDHVHEFLAQFGIADLPREYFDGVDSLASELDELARRRVQAADR